MNYSQAFLWVALTVMTGIAVFVFYMRIKGHKDEKKPESKDKKRRARRSDAIPSGKGERAKASQGENSIATQIPGVNHGNVNVINITNYTLGAGKDVKDEHSNTFEALRDDILGPGFSAAKDVATLDATQETTPCNEKKKPGAKVYFLSREKEQEVLSLAERSKRAKGGISEVG